MKVILIDDLTDEKYVVPQKRVVLVGRSNKNDLVIPARRKNLTEQEKKRFCTISRFHCEIHQDEKGVYVMDNQETPSSQGTMLDGESISVDRCGALENGSVLELGGCMFEVRIEDEKETGN